MLEKEIFDLIVGSDAIGVKAEKIVVSGKDYTLSERICFFRGSGEEVSLLIKECDFGDIIQSENSQFSLDYCNIKFLGPFSGVYFTTYFGNLPFKDHKGEITEISIWGKLGVLHIKVGDISNLLFNVVVEM